MKICVYTGSRAEYNLLQPLINKLEADNFFKVTLYASGMHLSKLHGWTISEVTKNHKKVHFDETVVASDSPDSISKSTSLTIMSFSSFLKRNDFDLLIVLGDRYEAFAACIASLFHNLPIAHLCGGESTEGLIDEAIRHSITKMSHIHFVTNKQYAENVKNLKENKKNIFNVGSLGIENLKKMKLFSSEECTKKIGLDIKNCYLVTYHPITLSKQKPKIADYVRSVMKLDSSANFIITYPNADTHSSQIFNQLELLKKKYGSKIYLTHSLGQHLYFSCAKHCKGAFGNSSSGVIELPYLTNVINIGNRQKGRVSPSSVIDCKDEISDFNNSVKKLINRKHANKESLYGDGKTSERILKILKRTNLEKILDKSIYS